MRSLVVSDVHASLTALDIVLAHAGPVDAIWCLGDLVDLGPDPEGCVTRLRGLGATCIRGNHDLGTGPEFARVPLVRESIAWTHACLSEESRAWLTGLPERVAVEGIDLLHDVAEGGPTRAPEPGDFAKVGRRGMLVGHFHLPFVLRDGEVEGRVLEIGANAMLERSILNPGPVGVSDWRPGWATYGVLDAASGQLTMRAVEVEVAPSEGEIARLDAPPRLIAYWRRMAADAAQARGEHDRARDLFARSAGAFDSPGDQRQLITLLVGLVDLARRAGDHERAAQLLGAVKGAMAEPPVIRHRTAHAGMALRDALGDDALQAARQIGAALTPREAIALGLDRVSR